MTDCATKDDLLGTEDTIKGGGFFSKPQVRKFEKKIIRNAMISFIAS